MRGGKAVYTTGDSCYHKEKGAEKTLGGGGGERYDNSQNFKNLHPLGLVSGVTVMYFAP